MNSMKVVFLLAVGLAAPVFGSWGAPSATNWAAAPANIVLSQDGKNLLDTPEVAHARAAHLAALAQAQSVAGNTNDDGSYDSRWEQESYEQSAPSWNAAPAHNQWNAAPAAPQWNAAPAASQWNSAQSAKWQQIPANIALSSDGKYVLDTAEVAQARAAHLAAHAAIQKDAKPAAWGPASPSSWSGPSAAPAWNAPALAWNAAPSAAPSWNHAAPVPIADTPEVAQAKAAHNAAYVAAQVAASATKQATPVPWAAAPSWQSAPAYNNKWANAPAPITLSQDGQNILDTHEVAEARAAHLAAHAAAAASSAPAPRHW